MVPFPSPAGLSDAKAGTEHKSPGLSPGDHVAFRATGQIQFTQSAGQNAGPDGNDSVRRPDYPVTAMPVGGLIGKVGTSGPFPIGSNAQPIVMPAAGRLMLGVNDNIWTDNSGYFSVVITKS